MKNHLFFSILLLTQHLIFSQNWDIVDVVDEFGDKTGNKTYRLKVIGTFDNSAQTGSRAVLFLSFSGGKFYKYDNSIGSLWFEVYEYTDNPANFYREFETIQVNMKNEENKVFSSEIMTNEFSEDNEFSLTQYLYPEDQIVKRTKRKQIDSYTYELIKPTYDVDYDILNEILYKDQLIKLNIYSRGSSYYFKFKSLGLKFPDSLDKIKNEATKKVQQEKKLQKLSIEKKENKVEELLSSVRYDLDDFSIGVLKRFLEKFKEEVLYGFKKLELTMPNRSPDILVNDVMMREYRNISVNIFDSNGEIVDVKNNNFYKEEFAFKLPERKLDILKLNENSNFITKYDQEIKRVREILDGKVNRLFGDSYGGSYLKKEIKNEYDFKVKFLKIKDITSITFKFTEQEFLYHLNYDDGSGSEGRVSLKSYSSKREDLNPKKFLKENGLINNKEYSY